MTMMTERRGDQPGRGGDRHKKKVRALGCALEVVTTLWHYRASCLILPVWFWLLIVLFAVLLLSRVIFRQRCFRFFGIVSPTLFSGWLLSVGRTSYRCFLFACPRS